MLSTTSTPGCWPSRTSACRRTEPRALPRRTGSPALDPEPSRVLGMDQHGRPPLLADRGRRLGEAGVQVVARRRRHQAERALVVRLVDDREVVRQLRHARVVGAELRPVRLELEPAGRRGIAVQVMRRRVVRHGVVAARLPDRLGIGPARARQQIVDQLPLGHREARMACAETPRQLADHVVVGPAVGIRLEQLARDLDARVPGGLVDVVVLEELRGRQHDVRHPARSRS